MHLYSCRALLLSLLVGSYLGGESMNLGYHAGSYELSGVPWQPVQMVTARGRCLVALPGYPSCSRDSHEFKFSSEWDGCYYVLIGSRGSERLQLASSLLKSYERRLKGSSWESFEIQLIESDVASIEYGIEYVARLGRSRLRHRIYVTRGGYLYHLYVWSMGEGDPCDEVFESLMIEER